MIQNRPYKGGFNFFVTGAVFEGLFWSMKFLLGAKGPKKVLEAKFLVNKFTLWQCRSEIKSKFKDKFLEKVGFDGQISNMHHPSESFYTNNFTMKAFWGLMAPSKDLMGQNKPSKNVCY